VSPAAEAKYMSVTIETPKAVGKTPTRPNSQWATGKRKQQKGFTEPKGFARGAQVKPK
jgi:hypothetical protein